MARVMPYECHFLTFLLVMIWDGISNERVHQQLQYCRCLRGAVGVISTRTIESDEYCWAILMH